jgi:hypothetical protein
VNHNIRPGRRERFADCSPDPDRAACDNRDLPAQFSNHWKKIAPFFQSLETKTAPRGICGMARGSHV